MRKIFSILLCTFFAVNCICIHTGYAVININVEFGRYCPSDVRDNHPCDDNLTGNPENSFLYIYADCASENGPVTQCEYNCKDGYYGSPEYKVGELGKMGIDIGKCKPCGENFICKTDQCNKVTAISGDVEHLICESVRICPVGRYLTNNGNNCTLCPAGTYTDKPDQESCTACRAGTYNPNTGSTSANACQTCDAGYYCPAGSGQPKQCGDGYYCPAGSGTQTPCPAGYYCPAGSADKIPCEAGSVSDGYDAKCTKCSAGKYETYSRTACYPCPAGTYNDQTGQSGESACKTLRAGYYSAGGATSPTPTEPGDGCLDNIANAGCGPVAAGYYSTGGAKKEKPTTSNDCVGTTTDGTPNTCGQVAKGYYSTGGATSATPTTSNCVGETNDTPNTCGTLAAGYYSIEPGMTTPTPTVGSGNCSKNTINSENDQFIFSACGFVAPGYYSTGGGIHPQGQCVGGHTCGFVDAGYYSANGGTSATPNKPGDGCVKFPDNKCGKCTAGYYCPYKAMDLIICDTGHYCLEGSESPTKCPAGTYNPETGGTSANECIACQAGTYSDAGQSACTKCKAGTYSKAGYGKCIECDAGTYSGAGQSACTECRAGTYNEKTGQSTCENCPDGYYCIGGAKTACDAGYYCPAGSGTQTACPAGTTSEAGATAIINCFIKGGTEGTQFCTTQYGCFTIPENIIPENIYIKKISTN